MEINTRPSKAENMFVYIQNILQIDKTNATLIDLI